MTSAGVFTESSADTYDAWYVTPVGQLTDALEKGAVFSLLPDRPGWALDLSCGTGNYAVELWRRGWRVVGVDQSMPMLRQAQLKLRKIANPPGLLLADAAHVPLRSATMNLVTIILGLEFMANPARALKEARRVLAPDGVLLVAALSPIGTWNLWRRLKRRWVRSIWREARFLDERHVRSLITESGLIPGASVRAVHFVPLVPWTPILRLWEWMARRMAPALAAFVVFRCEPDTAETPGEPA